MKVLLTALLLILTAPALAAPTNVIFVYKVSNLTLQRVVVPDADRSPAPTYAGVGEAQVTCPYATYIADTPKLVGCAAYILANSGIVINIGITL